MEKLNVEYVSYFEPCPLCQGTGSNKKDTSYCPKCFSNFYIYDEIRVVNMLNFLYMLLSSVPDRHHFCYIIEKV